MRTRYASKQRGGEESKKAQTQRIVMMGAAALGVVILAALLYLALREPTPLAGLARIPGLAREHNEEVEYSDTGLPPAGGEHSATWLNCGIYTEPVETKNVIHSLEHGAAWITYQPELPADDVERLQDIARGEEFLILSPFPGQRSPIVLTAWGLQLEVESARDGRIANFVERYQKGPQSPEPGGACTNGTGEPIG